MAESDCNTKRCSKCRIEKPRSDFPKDKSRKDGLTHNCRECRNANHRDYRVKNLETIRKTSRESARRNAPKHRDNKRGRQQEYYNANRDKLLTKAAARRSQNPEYPKNYRRQNKHKIVDYRVRTKSHRRESTRLWRQKNKMRRTVLELKRRARKQKLPCAFTVDDYRFMMDYWGGCILTGSKDELHIDHWIALSSPDCPGTVPENMIPLRADLNTSKGAKSAEQWLTQLFDISIASEILARVNHYFTIVRARHGR